MGQVKDAFLVISVLMDFEESCVYKSPDAYEGIVVFSSVKLIVAISGQLFLIQASMSVYRLQCNAVFICKYG